MKLQSISASIYTVAFNSQGGSSVASKTVPYNGLVAKPANPTRTGYTFGGWYKQAACTTAWNFATDKVTANITLYAKWNPIKYTIAVSANSTSYGTVTGGGSIAYGTSITVRATPKTGYRFVRWLEGSTQVSTSASYTFTVTKARTLKAEFAPIPYAIAVSANSTSYGTVTGGGSYAYGTSTTVKATPMAGYRLVRWLEGTTTVSTSASYTFTVTKARTLKAEFAAIGTATVKAASAGYNSIKLTWGAVAGAQGYEVSRYDPATKLYKAIATVTATSYANTGLITGTTYSYKVRAKCVAGSAVTYGGYSATASAKPTLAAAALSSATATGYNSVKLTWSAVAGAGGYEVYRAASTGGTYAKVMTTTALNYTNTGLATGTTYYYKVRAYRTVGGVKVYGGYSAVKTAKPVLATPTSVQAARASASSVKVTWGAVTGAGGYEVYRAATAGGTYTKLITTAALNYTNTGLVTGRTYYYKVRAYRTVSGVKVYGGYSAVVSARPAS